MTSILASEPVPSRRWNRIALGVMAVPILIIIILSKQWSHGVPCIDEWMSVDAFQRSIQGQTVWTEFFNQRTLHIVPVEALSLHLTFMWLDGDMRYLVALAILLVSLSALMLWRLAQPLLTTSTVAARVVAAAWIGFALFSPLHAEIWQWGDCWPVTVPFASLCAGLLLIRSARSVWLRAFLLFFLTVFAFLSHSGGLPVGAVFWLVVALSSSAAVPGKRSLLIAWTVIMLGLGATLAGVFDFGQVAQTHDDRAGNSAATFSTMLQSLLGLMGHGLSLGTVMQSIETSGYVGAVVLLFAVVLFVQVLRLPANDARRDAAMPWLAVIAFSLGNALLLAATRGSRGPWLTYQPRYLMLTMPAVIAVALLFAWAWRSRVVPLPERWRVRGICVAGGLLGAALTTSWAEGITWMKLWHVNRLQGEALVAYSQVLPWRLVQAHELGGFDHPIIPEAARFLHSRGALANVTLLPDGRLDRWRQVERPMPNSYGRCTSATQNPDGSVTVEGYADMRGRGRPSDLVMLARTDADGTQVMISATVPACPADYFLFDLDRKRDFEHYSRWRITVPTEQLPAGQHEFQVWSLDILRKEVQPILPRFSVDKTHRPVRPEYLLPISDKQD